MDGAGGAGTQHPEVSVVILTFNAGPGFEALLKSLSGQRTDFAYELVVVDSGSTDGTPELAERYGAEVQRISQSEFNHGATRNLGVSHSRGEFVALIVQDALPLDEGCLAALVDNLEGDEAVAGVYGRQLPHADASLLTRALTGSLASASLERREQYIEPGIRYEKLPPNRRRRIAAFDNVCSCVRRSVWESLPFDETNFGEDVRWGKKVVEAGYKIVYEPRATVFHSHERGALYDLRRYYVDQRVLLELFGLRQHPSLMRLPMGIARTSGHLFRLLRREEVAAGSVVLAWLAVKYAVPTQLGAYLGARSPAIARLSPRAFEVMHRFLSKGI
jgi:rhamnosyltransferase